jgi:predicted amidohydrolase
MNSILIYMSGHFINWDYTTNGFFQWLVQLIGDPFNALVLAICYDNNIIENVRATNLLGADIIFMPHVTMCTPSPRPGAGFVDPKLWENKENDPTSLRKEFNGLKGREWLMKWLPARAYDNGIYAVFSNAIGMDDDQLKNGCSMIIDPFGDIIGECHNLGDDLVTATCTADKIINAGGYRYKKARRPDLYGEIISKPNKPEQNVAWLDDKANLFTPTFNKNLNS